MENDGSGTDGLYKRLIAQGTPQDEIDAVYRRLRGAGYGAEEARARLEQALGRVRTQRAVERRHAHRDTREHETLGSSGAVPSGRCKTSPDGDRRRLEDWFPSVTGKLRRRINRWAHSKRLLICGLRERCLDVLSIVRRSTPDLVNPRLLHRIGPVKHYLSEDPYDYTLATNLDALYATARKFLGRSGTAGATSEREAGDALRRRDPFGYEFLSHFAHFDDTLRRNFAYIELAAQKRLNVTAPQLARITRETYRLILTTERVPSAVIERILDVARDVVRAYRRDEARGLDDAAAAFRIALDNLQVFKYELYPIVLRAMKAFYEYEDDSEEKNRRLYAFLELRDEDILTVEGFHEREKLRREAALAEQQRLAVLTLEHEKDADFAHRFTPLLTIMSTIFPDSGIENFDRGRLLLPYFDERVFTNVLPFDHGTFDIEIVSRNDPMQPIMIFHRILDNFLNSIDHVALEDLLDRPDISTTMAELKTEWKAVYATTFDPYIRSLNEYARGVHDEAVPGAFSQTNLARMLEEEINGLRNLAIKQYGHTVAKRTGHQTGRLWLLVERLTFLLSEVGERVNQDLVGKKDPVSLRLYERLEERPIVDFHTHTTPGTPEFKPVIRQLRRYVEAKHDCSITSVARPAQLLFFDVFRATADLYRFITCDDASFLRASGSTIKVADEEDRKVWRRERDSRAGAGTDLLAIRLDEQIDSEYVDSLTGLKTKNYFLKKAPAIIKSHATNTKAISVVMIDIDHFKWINDELGHQKGDEILRDAAATVLDGIRRGSDIGIRFGGEVILVVTPVPLHLAVALGERVRHAQLRNVETRDVYTPVGPIAHVGGEPCGTFSVGVAERAADESLDACVARADAALYQAKKSRDTVVIARAEPGSFESYAQYAARVTATAKKER